MSQLFASGGQSIGASASVLPMSIHSGLISFRMDYLLAVQGTLAPSAELQIKDSANALPVPLYSSQHLFKVDFWDE